MNWLGKPVDTAAMGPTPPSAVYYVAEIRRGHMYDVLLRRNGTRMAANIGTQIGAVGRKIEQIAKTNNLTMHVKGRGLVPRDNKVSVATTAGAVAKAYKVPKRAPSEPILIVYRSIPGVHIPTEKPLARRAPLKLRLKSVTVALAPRKADGRPWDAFGGAPDPMITVRFNGNVVLRCKRIRNSLTATCRPNKEILASVVRRAAVHVMDADAMKHDNVGTATSQGSLRPGKNRMTVSGQLQSAELEFEIAP